jgi:hypothetical protein
MTDALEQALCTSALCIVQCHHVNSFCSKVKKRLFPGSPSTSGILLLYPTPSPNTLTLVISLSSVTL